MSLFSAIVPCYNEEENIDYFYQEFMKNDPFFRDHDLEFELLYVDDGSKDKTVEKVKAAIQAAYEEGQGKLKGNGRIVPKLETIRLRSASPG